MFSCNVSNVFLQFLFALSKMKNIEVRKTYTTNTKIMSVRTVTREEKKHSNDVRITISFQQYPWLILQPTGYSNPYPRRHQLSYW